MAKWTNKASKFLWDMVPVMLGVLFALYFNNVNEDYKGKRKTRSALAAINKELIQNKNKVEIALTYHQDLLKKIKNDPENVILQIRSAYILNSAWQTAIGAQIVSNIDYNLSLLLSEIYNYQDSYITLIANSDMALNQIRFTQQQFEYKDYIQRWYSVFEDYVYIEKQLLEKYDKAIKELNNYP